jgi:hypothetical protein
MSAKERLRKAIQDVLRDGPPFGEHQGKLVIELVHAGEAMLAEPPADERPLLRELIVWTDTQEQYGNSVWKQAMPAVRNKAHELLARATEPQHIQDSSHEVDEPDDLADQLEQLRRATGRKPEPQPAPDAVDEIRLERENQRRKWDDAHDDGHTMREIAEAAYCLLGAYLNVLPEPADHWGLIAKHRHPRSRLRIAAALIAAEMDRRSRATAKLEPQPAGTLLGKDAPAPSPDLTFEDIREVARQAAREAVAPCATEPQPASEPSADAKAWRERVWRVASNPSDHDRMVALIEEAVAHWDAGEGYGGIAHDMEKLRQERDAEHAANLKRCSMLTEQVGRLTKDRDDAIARADRLLCERDDALARAEKVEASARLNSDHATDSNERARDAEATVKTLARLLAEERER